MQWNRLDVRRDDPLLRGLEHDAWVYFVHSYAAEDSDDIIATCEYGGPVAAVVQHRNVRATQFHPEKSGAHGLQLLRNFVQLTVDASRQAVA
jgi:glutamine amidotransferase